jgi:membrane protein
VSNVSPMTVKAQMRRGLDQVHGATTTARLVLETTRACRRYLTVLVDLLVDTIAIMFGRSGLRGIVRTRMLSFSLHLTALVFGVVIGPLVLLGPTVVDGWLPERTWFPASLYWPAVVVTTVAALTTLFHIAAPHRAHWWRESPGAVLALLIWAQASFVVRGTVGLSLDGTSNHGPLSTPVVMLIWLSAVAIAVLVGAGLNAATRVLWPVPVRLEPTARLVEWARAEMERRRSYGEGEGDPLLDDLMASEQQYLDLAWPSEPREVERRSAS